MKPKGTLKTPPSDQTVSPLQPLSEEELTQSLAETVLSIENSDPSEDSSEKELQLQKELAAVREQLQSLKIERDSLIAKKEEYRSKYLPLKSLFQKQMRVFHMYQNLSAHSLDALTGIFKGNSFEEFLACGVQPGNIDALWEFARSEILLSRTEDLTSLRELILYFIDLYNRTGDVPILGIQDVNPKDTFDVDLHIRTQDSKPAGKIQEIILPGLTNALTGAVIKKAVVRVGD